MDIRTCPRHAIDLTIVCAPFHSRSRSGTHCQMRNYGLKGLYLESATPFQVGTVLLVRVASSPGQTFPAGIEEGFRTIALAEVKWSRPSMIEGQEVFGLGLKYMSVSG
jgi:hypothetical protein